MVKGPSQGADLDADAKSATWPAAGFMDTEKRCLMEPEVIMQNRSGEFRQKMHTNPTNNPPLVVIIPNSASRKTAARASRKSARIKNQYSFREDVR